MGYKEKFENFLSRMQGLLDNAKKRGHIIVRVEDLENTFPELVEIKDERMWELIKKYAHCNISDMALDADHITREQLESWLEKQYEQKSFNYENINIQQKDFAPKVEPKFHEGDWIVWRNQCYNVNYTGCGYELIDQNGLSTSLIYTTIDENAHLFSLQDAKDGDVLAFYSEYRGNKMVQVGIIEKYVGKHGGCSNTYKIYVGVNWENNLQIGEYMGCSNIRPATKEQRDTLFTKMHDAGYTFDFETKELKKIEEEIEIPFGAKDSELQEVTYFIPKGFHAEIDDDKVVIKKGEKPTAWSKEDELIISKINQVLNAQEYHDGATGIKMNPYNDALDWLKFLRPQKQWKPSEEQIKAIKLARSFVTDDFDEHPTLSEILVELEKQLKKLREE